MNSRRRYHRGDAQFENLKSLFGTDDIVPPGTIIISSDRPAIKVPNNVDAPIVIPDSDNEEVNSPDVHGRKPPRKKLFDESAKGVIPRDVSEESNSACKIKNHPISSSNKQLFRPYNMVNEVSSCASSSPSKFATSSIAKE